MEASSYLCCKLPDCCKKLPDCKMQVLAALVYHRILCVCGHYFAQVELVQNVCASCVQTV